MNKKSGEKTIPLFVSIPHSGVKIPPEADWLKGLDPLTLMCDVDAFVDDLYRPALEAFQIPAVIFKWHRYIVDVNRHSMDISSATVEGAREPVNRESSSDIHWHKTTKGELLIKTALSQQLHKNLIQKYFDPFHSQIEELLAELKKKGSQNVYLLDLHSMPSQGLDFHKDPGHSRPPVVIGDREGRACSTAFRDLALKAFQEAGFETALNWPYKGGAITQRYGQPELGQNSLQVELNRKLYMDEKTKQKNSNYGRIQDQLCQALAYIVQNL